MAITNFIPKLWSARLLAHLDKNLVYGNLVNRDYEGEISSYGDTVHINQIGNITVKKYTKGSEIAAPEDLSTADQTLVINQSDYFNFGIDDIDKAQARTTLMDKAMTRAAYGLSDAEDKFLADEMSKNAGVKLGSSSQPINITAKNAFATLVRLKTAMDKENVPTQGRWVVVPPEFEGLMLLDTRFAGADGARAEERLINGLVGRAAGFDIYISNNVPVTAGKYSIVASNNDSTTFAKQIVETEAYRPEKSFKDAMKGLSVYGAKVTMPKAIAVLTATFNEEAASSAAE